jgi:hypothetical protein
MRNRLVIGALMALLGFMPDVPVLAQFSQPETPAEGLAAGAVGEGRQHFRYYRQHREYRGYKRSSADRHERRDNRGRYANRKGHVFRSLPNQRKIAEENGYKRVSDLVNFPKFFPGLGIIFVKPQTLPIGPFLCFDRRDHLIATVYMIPIKDIEDHKSFEASGFAGRADHVSIYFNPGHPGVDVPHYHFVIWNVSKKEEARVAK